MDRILYLNYLEILKDELQPALGCTEPIAVAYAAAKAREVLGCMPEKMSVMCSGNIIKNVMGVTVPNSGGLKGVDTAAVLGCVGGDASLELEVLSPITNEDRRRASELLAQGFCSCALLEQDENLHIICQVQAGENTACVEIKSGHTRIVKIIKNGMILFSLNDARSENGTNIPRGGDRSLLKVKDIYAFTNLVELKDVQGVIEPQIQYNSKIAREGLQGHWGLNVGAMVMAQCGEDLRQRASALAAAGSDARMSGCSLPVVINSGSGNQGMAVSLPVIEYARALSVSHEKLIRALVLTNLIAIHQKRFIGSLSAYCGASSAGAAAACGIAYLYDEPLEVIDRTIINTIATIGGMVCDGAKPSCAAKLRSAVDTAIFSFHLAREEKSCEKGEGLVAEDVEHTIENIGRMGRVGMASTDIEILNIMLGH